MMHRPRCALSIVASVGALWLLLAWPAWSLDISVETTKQRIRARDLGLTFGQLQTGPLNAITDVAGVKVGQVTLVSGDGPLKPGEGPVRTGVTVVVPRHDVWREKV